MRTVFAALLFVAIATVASAQNLVVSNARILDGTGKVIDPGFTLGERVMRQITFAAVLFGAVLMTSTARAADPAAACALITQTQVSEALGASVDAGKPISRPGTCQWIGKGRYATLTINQPRGGKSPVEQFNAGKKGGLAGAVIAEPVSGVGDDAYYVYLSGTTRAGLGLMVKKGSSAFEVRVYGFDIDKAKPVAKTLAQEAAGKI